ncbi:MAG: aldehyde dehydrogenase family protein [candidate division WOR-3 bacterium]|nr:aldehyde dehydrogenase family protein [candidate division WOR-3 bacterium]MCX7948366.1 aldehyde dehydrogenase family protein [candidate division WOR-3 bacterium]MDW8151266.1 aldehyde dehydrogenase family protein [candidate division WOR-3 bacterium]
MKEYKNYIGGKYQESRSDEKFESRNPANWEEVIGTFPESNEEDLNLAVESAKKAFKLWSKIPAPKRGEIIRKAGEIFLKRKREIAILMSKEIGKTIVEAEGDIQEAIDTAFYASGEGRRLFSYITPSELPNKYALTFKRPIGVVGVITAWNFPIAVPSWKIFPALLAGNTIVFKPAPDASAVGSIFAEIFEEAGLPEGVFNIVYGHKIGKYIVEHPDIKVIAFTGGTETGKIIYQNASKYLKRVSLELGGKNPQIVMPSANLDLAVDGAIWGAFGTSGQRCTSTSRLILHEKIYSEFMEKFKSRLSEIIIGDPLDPKTNMGPIINQNALEKIKKYVEIGKQEGAILTYGGNELKEGYYSKGFWFEATIFENVKENMRIFQEEIFGPILSIIKVGSFEEAIEVANNSKYGLSSSIYTNDINEAMKAIELIDSGITYINAPTIGAESHLPFGGVKETGNGYREGGWTVFDIFTEWKTVYIDFSQKLQKAQIDTWK